MREILFQGKRKTDGKWVEGSLLNVKYAGEEYALIFSPDFIAVAGEMKAMSHALVLPETVGQFTGKKDRLGRKIFAGNICRFWNDAGETSDYNVLWLEAGSRWGVQQTGSLSIHVDALDDFFCGRCEVVGNTYDGIDAQ